MKIRQANPEILASNIEVESAVKAGAASLLARLGQSQDLDPRGSEYLGLHLMSPDKTTGLVVVTDASLGEPRSTPAFMFGSAGLSRCYCSEVFTAVYVKELSPGNLNVKELHWDARQQKPVSRYTEEGLSRHTMYKVLGGQHGWLARVALAPYFGLKESDFVLADKRADAATVEDFMGEVLSDPELDNLEPVTFGFVS